MCEKDIFTPEQSEGHSLWKSILLSLFFYLEKGCHPNFPLASLLSLFLERLFFVVLESIASRPFPYR